MTERSIHDVILITNSLPIAAKVNGAENGASVDGAESDAKTFLIEVGTWTDGTHTLTFEDGDDGVAFAAIVAADLDEQNAGDLTGASVVIGGAGDNDKRIMIGYIGGKRHTRVVRNTAGATVGAVLGASVVEGRRRFVGKTPMTTSFQT